MSVPRLDRNVRVLRYLSADKAERTGNVLRREYLLHVRKHFFRMFSPEALRRFCFCSSAVSPIEKAAAVYFRAKQAVPLSYPTENCG